MKSVSALGAAANGAGSLIDAVGNLLPSTTTVKGHTETSAEANSNTLSGELSAGSNSSTGTSKTKGTKTNVGLLKGVSSELGGSSQTGTNTGTSTENFSGQENSTTTQTMLTDEGVMRIVNMMLQGNGGVPGLAETVTGERVGGLFNSSTNSLLSSNLVATIGGEVARLSAPTVQSQSLGATQTVGNNTTSSLMDAVTRAVTNQNQESRNSEASDSTTNTQEDVLNLVLGLAQQLTDQSSSSVTDNKSKTKSGKCGILAVTTILMLPSYLTELDSIRNFRDTYVSTHYPDQIPEYYAKTSGRVKALERLDMDSQYRFAQEFFNLHYIPTVAAHKAGNNELAYKRYLSMLAKFDSIKGV